MGSIPVRVTNKKVPFVYQTKGTFLSDAFLAERDAHFVRDVGFACDARLRRVGRTHRITYHSAAASLITYLQTILLCDIILKNSVKESIISNQIGRSGTSIGANIHEANYAHSKSDFIAKLQIALKECYETEYWLELFVKSDILNKDTTIDLCNHCGTIRRILIASINTAKEHMKY